MVALERLLQVARARPSSARPSTVSTRAAVGLHRERQAGARGDAVDAHRAGAADAVLAADVGAGRAELVAQEVATAACAARTARCARGR